MKCDIFISYRRVDGRDVARTVQLALKAKGYENIFFDYDSLRDGLFNEQIIDAINMCKDFILILSPESMKRCCNEGDWVARELDTAIKAGCKFIPLNINGSFQEFPADFPRSLSVVKYIEQTKLMTDEYFDASIEMLVNRLDSKPVRTAVKSALCSIQLSIDETSMVYLNNEQLFKLKAGGQRLIENLETDKEYTLRAENLSRRGEEIVKTFIPGDQSILALSYAAEREERKRLEQEEKARKKAEEEQREREWNVKSLILCSYDDWWDGGEANEVIVEKKGLLGYLESHTYAQIIDCKYDRASIFVDGVACVQHDNQYDLINMSGQVLQSNISECMTVPYGGYVITERGGMMGLIDLQGKQILPHQYDEVLSTEMKHMYIVKKEGMWAIYHAKERNTVSAWYNDMQLSGVSEDRGRLTMEQCYHYDGIWPIVVRRGKKYGLLNNTGDEVFACIADQLQVSYYYKDRAIVSINGKYGLVNRLTGQMITMMEYDVIHAVHILDYDVVSFFVGYGKDIAVSFMEACAMDGGVVGVIDAQGNEIVPIMYDVVQRWAHDEEIAVITEYVAYNLKTKHWDAWHWKGEQISSPNLTLYTERQIEQRYNYIKDYIKRDTNYRERYYEGRKQNLKTEDSVTGVEQTKLIEQTKAVSDIVTIDIAKLKEQTQTALSIFKVNYNLDTSKNTAEITGFVKDFSGELIIPEMLWHLGYNMAYRVTSISSYGFRNHTGITAITLPEGVSKLDEYTFYQCTSLKRVTLPKSLRIIGQQCFQECTALTEIVIPEGVTEIQDWAFSGCSSLKRIVLPNSVTTMGQQVFRECRALEEIVLPRSIETMGDYMFHDCPNLKRICVPKGQKEKFRKLVGLNIFNTNKLVEY